MPVRLVNGYSLRAVVVSAHAFTTRARRSLIPALGEGVRLATRRRSVRVGRFSDASRIEPDIAIKCTYEATLSRRRRTPPLPATHAAVGDGWQHNRLHHSS